MAGSVNSGNASARMRPCPSTGTRMTRSLPNPSKLSAFNRLTCTSSPTITITDGAPNNPFASTSQPCFFNIACRAAAKAVKFAMVAPLTNPPPASAGKDSTSSNQPRTTFSITEAIGDITFRPAFWSHAPANQLAARAAGRLPPVTNPK